MRMSEIIRARRRALGLTQEEAASRLGVTASAFNKWGAVFHAVKDAARAYELTWVRSELERTQVNQHITVTIQP